MGKRIFTNSSQKITIVLLFICIIIIFLEWHLFAPVVRLNSPSDKLPCVEEIVKVMNKEELDPVVKDFLSVVVEYGLTKQAQENYHSLSFQKGWHFKDSEKLKKAISKAPICDKSKYEKVVMCSIVGEGINYVQEWISHYILLGVDKFFIYTDQNTEQWEERLKPFIELNIVKLTSWETRREKFGQRKANDNCIKTARDEGYDWGLFLDLDEYVTFNIDETCLPKFFHEFSAKHTDPPVGGIALRYYNMKPSGVHDDKKTLYEQMPYEHEFDEHQTLKKLTLYLKAAKFFDNAHVINLEKEYSQYNAAGGKEDGLMNVFNDINGKEDHSIVSLRHFWGFNLDYMIYEKVCGLGHERRKLSYLRAPMMMEFISKNRPPKFLPTHPHQFRLHSFLFDDNNNNEEGQVVIKP